MNIAKNVNYGGVFFYETNTTHGFVFFRNFVKFSTLPITMRRLDVVRRRRRLLSLQTQTLNPTRIGKNLFVGFVWQVRRVLVQTAF